MTRKYFGTDGVRGRVGQTPITPEFALKLGWAAGRVLGGSGALVLIGKDTRRSGYLLESALEAGFAAAGMDVGLLGPIPTPGVAYLTRELGARSGVVISASHNQHYDNGVKFFSDSGCKLSDALELRIEELLDEPLSCVEPERVGAARRIDDAIDRYVRFCAGTYRGPALSALRIVVDCANGAAYRAAPMVLEALGAQVTAIAVEPDGFNINRDCGSTHIENLQGAVLRLGADLGIALDGDGDRCLMVDSAGREVDGDQILYAIARDRLANGGVQGPVVGTLMTNLGLERALQELGIPFERVQVGDRYVFEKLRAAGGVLGGETSGHILCLDRATTGDGIVTALQVLSALAAEGRPLSELVSGVHKMPQVLINVRVPGRAADVLQAKAVQTRLHQVEKQLARRGRVLLRASGTEPLIRVMVEAEDEAETRAAAEALAESVRAEME